MPLDIGQRATEDDGRRAFRAYKNSRHFAGLQPVEQVLPSDAVRLFLGPENKGREDWLRGWQVELRAHMKRQARKAAH